jgi:rhodanese-related sulfurtransferase
MRAYDLRRMELGAYEAPALEIEEIPEGAVVIDLRSPQSYRAWHYPGALYKDFLAALRSTPHGRETKSMCSTVRWGSRALT